MKSLFFSFVFCCCTVISLHSQVQVVQGTVYDSKTQEAIPGVVVYLDGTSVFTTSDIDGKFRLQIQKGINASLIFSHLSYELLTLTNPLEHHIESFFLKEKNDTLMEARVVANRNQFSRKAMMRVFREQFLGTSTAGKSAIILNEDDIVLHFDLATNRLTAYAENPIIIENKYLAYRVFYNLQHFSIQFNYRTLFVTNGAYISINGSSFFEDQSHGNSMFAIRRDEVYVCSKEYFWRNFVAHTLEEAKISIYNDSKKINLSQYFSIMNLNLLSREKKVVQIIPDTNIMKYHKDVKNRVVHGVIRVEFPGGIDSEIVFLTNGFSVSESGNIENQNIIYLGHMGQQRLGNSLPLDYVYTPPPPGPRRRGR